jgi:uncharacterized protein YkwD
MRLRSIMAALLATLALGGQQPAAAAANSQGGETSAFSARLLLAQNAERRSLGLRPMRWDPQLAAAASTYANEMAATGEWGHSDDEDRPDQGENLWMGTRGAYTAEEMVGDWIAEKKVFRAGVFPDVSSTGNWADVGHYTQIVWADTDRIGCGLGSSSDDDYLVCRYAHAGNVMGEAVLPTRLAAID